jgi:hypothetical protein
MNTLYKVILYRKFYKEPTGTTYVYSFDTYAQAADKYKNAIQTDTALYSHLCDTFTLRLVDADTNKTIKSMTVTFENNI